MRKKWTKRFAMLLTTIMIANSGCNSDEIQQKGNHISQRVSIPSSPIFNTKPLPELDRIFESAEKGTEAQVELSFPKLRADAGQHLSLHNFDVKKGSVALTLGDAKVRLMPDGRFEVKLRENEAERKLKLSQKDRFLAIDARIDQEKGGVCVFSIGGPSAHPLDEKGNPVSDLAYSHFKVPMQIVHGDQCLIFSLEATEDFEGDFSGWFLWTPK